MPIDWAAVNWVYVALLSGFAFLGSLIGNLLSFRSRLVGAILAAVLFPRCMCSGPTIPMASPCRE